VSLFVIDESSLHKTLRVKQQNLQQILVWILPFLHVRLWVWKSQFSTKYTIIQNQCSSPEGVYVGPHEKKQFTDPAGNVFSYVSQNFRVSSSFLMYLIHVLEFAWSNIDIYSKQSSLCCHSSVDGFRLCLLDSSPQEI